MKSSSLRTDCLRRLRRIQVRAERPPRRLGRAWLRAVRVAVSCQVDDSSARHQRSGPGSAGRRARCAAHDLPAGVQGTPVTAVSLRKAPQHR